MRGDFDADVGADAGFLCGEMETRGAIYAVAVEQRHGGHVQLRRACSQLLRQGSAFEETKGRSGMKFDVHEYQYSVLGIQYWDQS
jgi:hypothetical protein